MEFTELRQVIGPLIDASGFWLVLDYIISHAVEQIIIIAREKNHFD